MALGALGLWLCAIAGKFTAESPKTAWDELEDLPDYDYLQEIGELEAQGRLTEAEQLADWVLDGSAITNRAEVAARREAINARRVSFRYRASRAARGFIYGSGASVEELGGAVVSDFLLWGDIRDLAKEGYNKATGRDTDPVVAGLAAAGILTSVASAAAAPAAAADASISFLKILRRSRRLTTRFSHFLVEACKRSKAARSLDKGLGEAFVGIKNLIEGAGTARAATIMGHIDDVEALKAVAKVSKASPEPAAILVRAHGAEGVEALKRLAKAEDGPKMLEKLARKGTRQLATLVKRGARVAKSIRHGRFSDLLALAVNKLGRLPVALVSALLALLGFSPKRARTMKNNERSNGRSDEI